MSVPFSGEEGAKVPFSGEGGTKVPFSGEGGAKEGLFSQATTNETPPLFLSERLIFYIILILVHTFLG